MISMAEPEYEAMGDEAKIAWHYGEYVRLSALLHKFHLAGKLLWSGDIQRHERIARMINWRMNSK